MQGFIDINSAREWVLKFVNWYNFNHKHSGLNFITPHQRHTDQADKIFTKRDEVYKAAREKHPHRWSKTTRNWTLTDEVWLNPETSTRSNETEDELVS
jgi:putative transposase